MLPAEFELLLKVLSAPDDDEPRLVYADVLQERGEVRGEFIPLQCALARSSARSDPDRFSAMRAREGELLGEHAADWVEQSIPFGCLGLFRRGFVEELQCLAGELLHRGLEVVAPVRVLRLDGDTSAEVAQRVMALPMGARVTELTLRLVDSAVDASLKSAGAGLVALRQLSADANTIEVLQQLGWLWRLQRLELPLMAQSAALLGDLAYFKPPQLKQLWLHRQSDGFGRQVLNALDQLWNALPELSIRWRGVDYLLADAQALAQTLSPARVEGQLMIRSELHGLDEIDGPYPRRPPATPALTLIDADPPESPPVPAAMELVPMVRPAPTTAPWDRWLLAQGLESRGFLPRALPQRVTVVRALEHGDPVLVTMGPANTVGALSFAEDVAQLMTLRSPGLLHLTRTGTLGNERGAVSEPFEGVTLWELLQVHRRLEPGVGLRIICQVARVASAALDRWQPSTDDVLLDVGGGVRLLSGFPASLRVEEPSYTGREQRHLMGAPLDDTQAPGARVMQLGTALFELLTGTTLFDITRRSMVLLAADWSQVLRQLDRDGLSLVGVDPALAPYEELLAKALTHAHGERFEGLAEFAEALERHPATALSEQLARQVRETLPRLPRTRDGR